MIERLTALRAQLAGSAFHATDPEAAGTVENADRTDRSAFHTEEFFDWQQSKDIGEHSDLWKHYSFDPDRWWGGFPKGADAPRDTGELFARYAWALGPFTKHPGNPVLAPTPGAWDQGHYGGGCHNGSVVVKDDLFYYIYRGERPIEFPSAQDYVGDAGLATSHDGVRFVKRDDVSPFFRKGDDFQFSFEDMSVVQHGDTYYLFCNRWNWNEFDNPRINGTHLAVSQDLLRWEKVGMVFPKAERIHRNAVVVQNPENQAVAVGGRYVMYINDGLMAYSDDLLHWESFEDPHRWPGGEGCFALADHRPDRPDDILLFTGGHHCGHFYALGQVLLSKREPERPTAYLPRPFLCADPRFPYENGYSADAPHRPISPYADCIFFDGLTRHNGAWLLYYGGSEYYTCLATAPAEIPAP